MVEQPFTPQYGATQTAATAAAAVNVNVTRDAKQLLVYNDASDRVFVRVKPSGNNADASVADMPLGSKVAIVISKDPQSQNVVSVFSPGGALGNVYITPGEGQGGPLSFSSGGSGTTPTSLGLSEAMGATGYTGSVSNGGQTVALLTLAQNSGLLTGATVQLENDAGDVFGVAYFPGPARYINLPAGTYNVRCNVLMLSGTLPSVLVSV